MSKKYHSDSSLASGREEPHNYILVSSMVRVAVGVCSTGAILTSPFAWPFSMPAEDLSCSLLKCSTIAAPNESPSTLTTVRKRSLKRERRLVRAYSC